MSTAATFIHRGMVLSHPSTHSSLLLLVRALSDWRYKIYISCPQMVGASIEDRIYWIYYACTQILKPYLVWALQELKIYFLGRGASIFHLGYEYL